MLVYQRVIRIIMIITTISSRSLDLQEMVPPVVGGLDLFHILPRRPIETETALQVLPHQEYWK